MWLLFGQGKNSSVYKINKIYEFLGSSRCRALPFFVAFTGCDTTSQFVGKGKVSAWNTWLAYPDVIGGFTIQPFETINFESEKFKIIERFVCLLYERTTDLTLVNKLRESMFPKKEFSQIPPTQGALLQHTKRCIYQASIWLKCMENIINAPDPSHFGWVCQENIFIPHWTDLPPISAECSALLHCGCKSMPLCSRNCRCKKVWKLPCTHLCYCKGQCNVIV